MRKLVVLAMAIVGLLVIVPVSPASAASFTGACAVSGNAAFPSPLTAVPSAKSYSFTTNDSFPVVGDTCVGSLNGGTPAVYALSPGNANASGSGTLSCSVSAAGDFLVNGGADGTGSITIGGQSFSFTVKLVGAGTEVLFVLSQNGLPAAVGHASFANPANAGAAVGCATGGVSSLHFDIEAASVTLSS
jgi:hypothetical protein